MKIQYRSTIDEAVDSQIRLLKTSGVARQWWIKGFLWVPILFFGFYFGIPDEGSVKIASGCFASIIFIILYLATHRKTIAKRLRKFTIEQLGTKEPVQSEYEFREDVLIFRKLGTEIRFRWENVQKVIENDKDVELRIAEGGIAVIPYRIFKNSEQKEKWIEFIKTKTGLI